MARFPGAMGVPSLTVPRGISLTDMEFQIHDIETEAYSAVLRAFIAQSEQLSWDKEGLISELRKELRVSDVEHREILLNVDSGDSIRMIREWRSGTRSQQEMLSDTKNAPGLVPISTVLASRKKLKTAHIAMPSPPMAPSYLCQAQPSPAVIPSSLSIHFIRDDQCGNDPAVFSAQGSVGQGLKSVALNKQAQTVGKVRASLGVQSKKGFSSSGLDTVKKGSDIIEIRPTENIIYEVHQRVFRAQNPDPAQVEKAKSILGEHERALLEAIEKLANVSDSDDSPDRMRQQYFREELQRNEHGTHHTIYGQVGRVRGYYTESFDRDLSRRAGIPCIDVDDEY